MNQGSVSAIVVTYNRKQLLKECLTSLSGQTRLPDCVYIIDNHSTDNTPEFMAEMGIINPKSIVTDGAWECKGVYTGKDGRCLPVLYIRLAENTGGAGGFAAGMRRAFKDGYEWLWVMDDDGNPQNDCLEQLLSVGSTNIPYVAPDLLYEKDKSHFRWLEPSSTDLVANRGGPFNAVLIHRSVIAAVGFPMVNFFIWGDEQEYLDRIEDAGFLVATYRKARHYHKITYINYCTDQRAYYLIRNQLYRIRLFRGRMQSRKLFILHRLFFVFLRLFLFLRHGNFSQVGSGLKGFWHGLRNPLQVHQEQSKKLDFMDEGNTP